jgi:hypothetical protein
VTPDPNLDAGCDPEVAALRAEVRAWAAELKRQYLAADLSEVPTDD